MVKIIIGVKGTGKTKTLIDMANSALETVNGCVVVIEKGTKLTHEIKNKARLVNTEEYFNNIDIAKLQNEFIDLLNSSTIIL